MVTVDSLLLQPLAPALFILTQQSPALEVYI